MRNRIVLYLFFSAFYFGLKAQSPVPMGTMSFMPGISYNYLNNFYNPTHQKWFFSNYAGISTGMTFYSGGSTSYLSAPIGIQLNRQINNNLYAFAGASLAPTYYYMTNRYPGSQSNVIYPMNSMLSSNNLGMYSRMEMGLMYVNDQKTFSISGSISIDRGTYPVYPYTNYNRNSNYTRLKQ